MYNTGNYIQNPMINYLGNFPDGPLVKNPPANAGDTGLIPGPGREVSRYVLKSCISKIK